MIGTFLTGIESLLFPASCPACCAAVEEVRRCPLCPRCAGRITPSAPTWYTGPGKKPSFDDPVSASSYETPVKELILSLKYAGRLSVAPYLAELLAREIRSRLGEDPADLIIPVPLHPVRLRERGFNQAAVLAEALARKTGLPCLSGGLLRRRPTLPQTDLSAADRRRNVREAFALGKTPDLRSIRILLVDDVFTTGATADACARILKKAGASRVMLATVARQDPPSGNP